MRLILAFAAAALVPAGVMTLWYLHGQFATFDAGDPYIWVRTRGFASLCLVVSTIGVLAIGIPAYLALRGRPSLRWWGAWLAGFLLAALPFGLFTFPGFVRRPGNDMVADGIPLIVDGMPTLAGWLSYLEGVACFGTLGMLSAAAFWAVSGMGKGKPVPSTSSDV